MFAVAGGKWLHPMTQKEREFAGRIFTIACEMVVVQGLGESGLEIWIAYVGVLEIKGKKIFSFSG